VAPTQPPKRAPAIELTRVTKRFPGVLANDRVSLTVRRGEVHCLLGENGAGKSTLISILSGMLRPDSGSIRVDGAEVSIRSPRDALRLGIGTVYQHSTLIPALTVLENLMLGARTRLRLDRDGARKRLAEMAAMLGIEVDPEARTGDLALGRQQQVEIISALWRGSRVLVLDEPTSMLTPQGVEELQKVLRRLKEQGTAIVFITHKLHEALAIGDRVSILRRGRLAGTLPAEQLRSGSAEDLRAAIIRLMFGDETAGVAAAAELSADLPGSAGLPGRADLAGSAGLSASAGVAGREGKQDSPGAPAPEGGVFLELKSVSARGEGTGPGIEAVSLRVRAGEILGVAGIDGNGQRSLAEAIAGQRRVTSGTVELFGVAVNRLSVSARQRLGLRYMTDDRLGEGIVANLGVSLNMFLKRIGEPPFWKWGRIDRRRINTEAGALVNAFDIRTPALDARAGTLSGGNMQKLLLARELSFNPKVVVFNKPTYGLDLKTTEHVRAVVRDLVRGGAAAMVISTDLDELIELSGRIAVLSRGRLVGVVAGGPHAAAEVGSLLIGTARGEAA
jgi:simple sugar transport system ATP-binding protein